MAKDERKDDDTRPATMEEINSISPERWAELDTMAAEALEQTEKINLVPHNPMSEQYIHDRYPIAALYARADIQEIAVSNFETGLTEAEIQEVRDAFFDEYPDEIHNAIADAIESVINERQQKTK
ncbi:MAG: hypothetical protein WAZ27_04535 [Minisyncoccia bacterium]